MEDLREAKVLLLLQRPALLDSVLTQEDQLEFPLHFVALTDSSQQDQRDYLQKVEWVLVELRYK